MRSATSHRFPPCWRRTGGGGATTDALVASLEAARETQAVFGLAEALAHLERALALWDTVPDAPELGGTDLAELCTWAAELASQTGATPRAIERSGRRAIGSPASTTHDVRESSRCASGSTSTPPAAARPCSPGFERAVELSSRANLTGRRVCVGASLGR